MERAKPDYTHEEALGAPSRLIAGVDEVGRGPLAGPGVAAAVILDPNCIPAGRDDSKKLSVATRERLYEEIRASSLAFAIRAASLEVIAERNILGASLHAMAGALAALPVAPAHALIDGNRLPKTHVPCTALVGGDAKSLSVAAASVLAKVARDRLMTKLARRYPAYGWERNAGYPTAAHKAALDALGPSPHHRMSFAPLRKIWGLDSQ